MTEEEKKKVVKLISEDKKEDKKSVQKLWQIDLPKEGGKFQRNRYDKDTRLGPHLDGVDNKNKILIDTMKVIDKTTGKEIKKVSNKNQEKIIEKENKFNQKWSEE